MGLDFSHGDAHWTYSGFMRFRTKLAAEIGVFLPLMEGFEREYGPESEMFKRYDDILPIEWQHVQHPLVPFLRHSDCDGFLAPTLCEEIARHIATIIRYWPKEDRDTVEAEKLIEGLEDAAFKKEQFEFH